jgi:hypothetical protein
MSVKGVAEPSARKPPPDTPWVKLARTLSKGATCPTCGGPVHVGQGADATVQLLHEPGCRIAERRRGQRTGPEAA